MKKKLVYKGLKNEGIVEKRFYERRAYESVDEKSLRLYVPKNDEKNNLVYKGLKKKGSWKKGFMSVAPMSR